MKFAVFGQNSLVLIFLLVLALASTLSFADSPPPQPSLVTVHLINKDIPETGIEQLLFHCIKNPATSNTAEELRLLNCTKGTCVNEPYHSLAFECTYFQSGYFIYNYQNQNRTSEMLNNSRIGKDYVYELDVSTGKLTLLSTTNSEKRFDTCGSIFLIILAFVGVGYFSRRR